MTITLYGNPASTYVRTALMTLIEKQVPFELDGSGLDTLEGLKSPTHLARHPYGRIPVLADGDFLVYETSAICRYVDALSDQGPGLVPAAPREAALMEQWISVVNGYMYENMARRFILQYVFPRGADGGPDRSVIDPALADIRRDLGLLDSAYGGRDFLVGDSLSFADLFVAPLLYYVARMPEGPELMKDRAHVGRAMQAMDARPSFAETTPPY